MPQPTVRGARPTQQSFHMCRLIKHSWDPYHPILERPPYGWRLSLRCTRCTTERHDLISPKDGSIMGRVYVYPDGYSTPKGDEKPTSALLRKELFDSMRDQLKATNAIAVGTARKAQT